MRGFLFLEVLNDPAIREKAKRFILSCMGAGFLKPQIDKCFKFEELREAHQYLESNQQIGKIIVRVDPV